GMAERTARVARRRCAARRHHGREHGLLARDPLRLRARQRTPPPRASARRLHGRGEFRRRLPDALRPSRPDGPPRRTALGESRRRVRGRPQVAELRRHPRILRLVARPRARRPGGREAPPAPRGHGPPRRMAAGRGGRDRLQAAPPRPLPRRPRVRRPDVLLARAGRLRSLVRGLPRRL
ncbi:MAG: hypothetical protein AVDCRST_MAG08-978, partial [uncultured Acetobacteraceae bacterium]